MQILSASKLKSYRDCPKRQHEEPYIETDAKGFGEAFHFAARMHLDALRAGKPTEGLFKRWYSELAAKFKLTTEHQVRADRAFQRWVDAHARLGITPESILSIESEDGERVYDFTAKGGERKTFFEVPVIDGVWGLRGAMDLVLITEDGGLRIPDWKTGFQEESDDLQAACYALAASLKYPGFAYYEPGYLYTESGKWVASRWDGTSLVGALEAVDKIARAFINEKDWAPKLNRNCSYCTLKAGCPEHQRAITQRPDRASWEIAPTVENFPLILERFGQIDAIRRTVMGVYETLKASRDQILKEHGEKLTIKKRTGEITVDRLRAGDRDWTGQEQASSYDYDVGRIFDEASGLIGRPPFEVLRLDSGAFDDLVAGQGDKTIKKALGKIKTSHRSLKSTCYKVAPTIAKGAIETEQAPDETDGADAETIEPIQETKSPVSEPVAPVAPTNESGVAADPMDSPGSSGAGDVPPSDSPDDPPRAAQETPATAAAPSSGMISAQIAQDQPVSPVEPGSTSHYWEQLPKDERAPWPNTHYLCVHCHAIEMSNRRITKCRHCPEHGAVISIQTLELARVAAGLKRDGSKPNAEPKQETIV